MLSPSALKNKKKMHQAATSTSPFSTVPQINHFQCSGLVRTSCRIPQRLLPSGRLALRQRPDQIHCQLAAPRDKLARRVGRDVQEDNLARALRLPQVRQGRVVDEVAQIAPGVLGHTQVHVLLPNPSVPKRDKKAPEAKQRTELCPRHRL